MRDPNGRLSAVAGLLLVVCLSWPLAADAGDRYALVVSGASGGPAYAQKYDRWRTALLTALREKYGFENSRLFVLGETPAEGVARATRENVRAAIATIRGRMTGADLLLVVLFGHGTFDGSVAKFNLVGPDMDAREWGDALAGLPGRLVFVNTASASFPFIEKLAGKGRFIITATGSPVERYETVFPEYFVKALTDPESDQDKNGRVSLWEAFSAASQAVRQYYQQRGQLPTERPLLHDYVDGMAKEANVPNVDSPLARGLYLGPDRATATADTALAALERQRDDLLGRIDDLKAKKPSMPAAEYEGQLETLLVDLARVSQQIRAKKAGS